MSEYWDKRMENSGHTGWSDPAIYAFDQSIRIRAVKKILAASGNNMLDFGCGTGDFSKALSSDFKHIFLYDICDPALEYAQKRISNSVSINSLDELEKSYEGVFDVILSVTVLQHIMDDTQLANTLKILKNSLNSDGKLLVVESFFQKGNSLQREWGYSQFEKMIGQTGFLIHKKYDFYYPDNNCKLFRKYIKRFDVRLLRKIYIITKKKKLKKMIEQRLSKISSKYNSHEEDFYFDFSEKKGTKIYILKK